MHVIYEPFVLPFFTLFFSSGIIAYLKPHMNTSILGCTSESVEKMIFSIVITGRDPHTTLSSLICISWRFGLYRVIVWIPNSIRKTTFHTPVSELDFGLSFAQLVGANRSGLSVRSYCADVLHL